MIKDITIGQYYQAESIIHRLDPRVKLMGTLVFIISLFLGMNIWIYAFVTVALATVIAISKIPLKFMVRGLKSIVILIIISAVFNLFLTPGETLIQIWKLTITYEGLKTAIFMVVRLVYLILGTSLMTLTTTPNNLTDGLEKGLGFLKYIKVPVHEIAMMMSIALRFIPILVEETDKIMKAQMARGADFENGNLIQIIENPQSDILGENYVFSPLKVAVDYADRIYVIAQNQFEGIMAFDAEGNFTGFTGTINVQITTAEIIWRKLSTKAQRAKQQLFIPTEFTGMEIDSDGFVYATNVDAEGEQSVRRLNPSGEDVIQKGAAGVSGDILWRLTGDYSGASRIIDVVVREKGIYSVIDSTRGRIFTYDHEGNLLYIFGGIGSQEGTFDTPTAIDTIGDEIIVLDGSKNLVDKYRATNYGFLINQAVGLRYDGDEASAVECWKQVLKLDSNFELAYVGIGKSYLAAGENKKAMECFKTGNNRQYYSIAYKRYRNEILKENLTGYLTAALVLIILLVLWNKIGKKKWKERRASHV